MKKTSIKIYSDASFSNDAKIGVGGFIIECNQNATVDNSTENSNNQNHVQTFKFKEQNNIRAEMRALFGAVETLKKSVIQQHVLTGNSSHRDNLSLTIYTDCQTIANLQTRRSKLEKNNFCSRKTGLPLSNKDLYQTFFKMYDQFNPTIIWVKGHMPTSNCTAINQIFRTVDKATRKHLRTFCNNN